MSRIEKKPVKKRYNRWVLAVPLLLIIAACSFLILEKSDFINLYDQTPSPAVQTVNETPANQIDYSPATSLDNETINNQKNNPKDESAPTPTNPTNNLSVTITSNTTPEKGELLEVRAVITPVISTGTCSLQLSKTGEATISRNVSAISQGSYSTCESLEIAPTQFSSGGTWDLSLTVTGDAGTKGTVLTKVEIQK